ncbi:MAG: hypothetical protein JXL81_05480 [Deltaproteobacteria bacterium]|nr:hypothetical protein [Deltaproteobacteria bacterium]
MTDWDLFGVVTNDTAGKEQKWIGLLYFLFKKFVGLLRLTQLWQNNINMLSSKAYRAELFPLTWIELKEADSFYLSKYLNIGGLPKAYLEDEGFDYLHTYILKRRFRLKPWRVI